MGTTTALPEFDLALSGGGRLRRDQLLGRRSILYFYPKDDTPGCTAQACSLCDSYADILASGAADTVSAV